MAGQSTQKDLFLEEPLYCLDTSSIIVLRQYYPKDINIFEELHNLFIGLVRSGKIIILNLVLDELKDKEPSLHSLVRKNIPPTRIAKFEDYINTTQRIIRTYYDGKGKSHKLKADPHVISCAKENKALVVTEEFNSDETRIPSVCIKEGVEYMNFLDLVRKELLIIN